MTLRQFAVAVLALSVLVASCQSGPGTLEAADRQLEDRLSAWVMAALGDVHISSSTSRNLCGLGSRESRVVELTVATSDPTAAARSVVEYLVDDLEGSTTGEVPIPGWTTVEIDRDRYLVRIGEGRIRIRGETTCLLPEN